jgi:hypothetical protein
MSFVYPIPTNGNLTNRTNFLIVEVTISANQTIAEGVPVLLSNAMGNMGSTIAKHIDAVGIGFDGAFNLGGPINLVGPAFSGTLLIQAPSLHNISLPGLGANFGGPDLVGERVVISWPVEGDYSASLVFIGTNHTIWTQDYPQNRVHVEPASTINQEKDDRNLNAIEIGGFTLLIYEALVRINEWENEREIDKRKHPSIVRLNNNASQQENTSPKKKPKAVRRKRSPNREHARKNPNKHQ